MRPGPWVAVSAQGALLCIWMINLQCLAEWSTAAQRGSFSQMAHAEKGKQNLCSSSAFLGQALHTRTAPSQSHPSHRARFLLVTASVGCRHTEQCIVGCCSSLWRIWPSLLRWTNMVVSGPAGPPALADSPPATLLPPITLPVQFGGLSPFTQSASVCS